MTGTFYINPMCDPMAASVSEQTGQTVDYLFSTNGKVMADELKDGTCPQWGLQTQFRVDFKNNDLVAGNSTFGSEPPTEFHIYRQKDNEDFALAAVVDGDKRSIIDYAICNNSTYKYYIYPASESFFGNPIATSSLDVHWNAWYLFVCDESENNADFEVREIYAFEFDLGDIQIQNNTTVNKIVTYARYPRIQKDSINAWSGTLSALIGKIDCSRGDDYFETADMTDAVRELSTDTRPKFLRDMEGHFYRVEVTSPVTWSQQYYLNGYRTTKSLEWTEIASSKGSRVTGDAE